MRIQPSAFAVLLLSLSHFPSSLAASKQEYVDHALNATDVLNGQWYNEGSGLWSDYWWNSGAILSTIGDVALMSSDFMPTYTSMASHILTAARAHNGGDYLNEFYDDEGWWAMAWIKAYDITQNTEYLDVAKTIFEDLLTGANATCGGHWWSKARKANTAIANELVLNVAASLATRAQDAKYRDYAQTQAAWLLESAMLNDQHTFNDGLDVSTCQAIGPVYSYNQGVILGALVEMSKLTGDGTYLDTAAQIAHGAISQLATPNDGILTDTSYPGDMDPTGAQFKGVFARNLLYLQAVRGDEAFVSFLQGNADSIWSRNRQDDGQMGALWQGPIKSISAASQGSAIDCLLAAAGVSG